MPKKKRVRRFSFRVYDAELRIRTDSKFFYESIRAFLDPAKIDRAPKHRFDFDIREVESLDGAYPDASFSKTLCRGVFVRPEDGAICFKWKHLGLAGRISSREKRVTILARRTSVEFEILIEYLLLYPLAYLTRGLGWHFFHGASLVDRDGRAMILMGRPWAGKTTAALALAREGFRFISDEMTIVRATGTAIEVGGFPRKAQVKEIGFKPFPELARRQKTFLGTGWGRRMVPIGALRHGTKATSPGRLHRVVFLRYSLREKTFRPVRLTVAQAGKILRQDPSVYLGYLEADVDAAFAMSEILLLRKIAREGTFYRCDYSKDRASELFSWLRAMA